MKHCSLSLAIFGAVYLFILRKAFEFTAILVSYILTKIKSIFYECCLESVSHFARSVCRSWVNQNRLLEWKLILFFMERKKKLLQRNEIQNHHNVKWNRGVLIVNWCKTIVQSFRLEKWPIEYCPVVQKHYFQHDYFGCIQLTYGSFLLLSSKCAINIHQNENANANANANKRYFGLCSSNKHVEWLSTFRTNSKQYANKEPQTCVHLRKL